MYFINKKLIILKNRYRLRRFKIKIHCDGTFFHVDIEDFHLLLFIIRTSFSSVRKKMIES